MLPIMAETTKSYEDTSTYGLDDIANLGTFPVVMENNNLTILA